MDEDKLEEKSMQKDEVLNNENNFDPIETLYTYGVQQIVDDDVVQILFMFEHTAKRLIIVNIHRELGDKNKNTVVRAFATKFETNQTVHDILEPFIRQLGSAQILSVSDLTEIWKWLPPTIDAFLEGEREIFKWFTLEDPSEVRGSFNEHEYLALIGYTIYPLALSEEFLEDTLSF